MKTVSVIPLKKGIFKDNLTYFSTKDVFPGDIVTIEIRSKKVLGLVISQEEASSEKSEIKRLPFGLKKITEIKEKSIFRPEFFESAILFSSYSASNKSSIITSLLPAVIREEYDKVSNTIKKNESLYRATATDKVRENSETKIKPEKLLFQASFQDRISYYKTLVRESFANKKSIFIMLPTEHDIEIFHELLHRGIENFIIAIHGGLSPKKQLEKFENILKSEHPVLVLGTPQYLSIPRLDIGTIILENESSSAYRSMDRARFDFRVFAEILSVKLSVKLIFADTILRFETIARKEIENIGEVRPLSFRINQNNCEITISGRSKKESETAEKTFKIFSVGSILAIKDNLYMGKNVFIFSLRKGLATMSLCKDCGEILLCDKCLSPVVLYLSKDGKKRMFVCNKCKSEKPTETTCENCGSWNIIPLGIGTDTVHEEIKKIFPKNEIFKLDKESAKTGKQAGKIISDFEKSTGVILIGTEMALFYLKEKVNLSIIASFDSLWSIPNFKMNEKILDILSAIISKTENKLIIETKNENDETIKAVKNENLASFVREELHDREILGYPPYKRFIKITHIGGKDETLKAKRMLGELFGEYNPEIFSGFIAKQKDKYVTNALIKIERMRWSLGEISINGSIEKDLLEKLLLIQPNFTVNVDPEDLL